MTTARVWSVALAGALLLASLGGIAGGDEKPEPPKGEGKVIVLDDFEAYPVTDKWDGGGQWQITTQPGCDFTASIAKSEGREGKMLVLKNVRTSEERVCKWATVNRELTQTTGAAVFTLSLWYRVPSAQAADVGRVDMNLLEKGGPSMVFLVLDPYNVGFVYEDSKDGGNKWANHPAKPAAWHKVEMDVDQGQQKFRVRVDDQVVKGAWGEWAPFRYNKQFSPAKPKILSFHAAHNWPSSARWIDDVTLTLPEKKP